MPPIGAAIAAITVAEIVSAVASVAIGIAANFIIGALTQSLTGADTATTATASHVGTLKQPLVQWQGIYGRTRIGGAFVYIHTSGPISPTDQTYANAQMTGAIVLACHQVDAIEKIYFGDEEIPLDPQGKALGRFAMYVNIIKHLGDPNQAADQMLIDASQGTWTAAHQLRGRAYIAFRLFYQKDLFPSMPQISALVRGKLLLDPRSGLTAWSDNAALCVFDYLRGTDGWQMGIAAAEISSPSFVAAANSCDEIVQTAAMSGNVMFLTGSFTAQVTKVFQRNNLSQPAVTVPSAFTLPNDDLKLYTGQRIQLGGGGLPTGVAVNVDYFVIRDHDNSTQLQQLNVQVQPTIQLASSLANANAGTYVAITTNGSGQIYRMEEFWMSDLGLAGLRTGDQVQITASSGTPPRPFTQGGTYYWIAYGVEQVKNFAQGNTISYGHGVLASGLGLALAGTAIPIQDRGGGGTITLIRQYERRYTCNGVIDTQQKPADILGQILSSCGGRLVNSGGLWYLYPAVWIAPSDTIDESDLRGPVSVQTLVSRRDLFNAVSGTYTSPAKQYQPTNFPPYPNQARPDLDVYLAEDGGERIWSSNIALPFTNSAAMAQRLAKILLMQVRQQISCTLPCKLTVFGITVPDNIYVNNARMGWINKPFEVINWTFRLDSSGGDGAPLPAIDLNLRETGSDVYSWDNGVELPDPASDASRLPAPTFVPQVHNVSAVEEIYVTQTGAGAKARIHVSWQPAEDGFTGRYQVAYWSSIDSIWRYPAAFPSETGTESYLYDLPPATYILSVRAINILNVAGLWSDYFTIVTHGLTALPHDLTNFRAAAMSGHAHLTWDLSPDIDVINGGQIWLRWTSALVNPVWGQGSMDLKLSGQATEATIFLKAGTYMARAVDSSGNASVNAVFWPIQSVDQPGWQTVIHTNEAPTFPGTKTNVVVSSSTLQLATGGAGALVDSWANVDAVANWDGEGATAPSGEYDFTSAIDLGAVYGFRMELFMDPNEVGGGSSDASVFPEISTTSNDPASGTAVWTAWAYYIVGDFVARGIKRRMRFVSTNPAANVFVTVLNDDLRMFQRQFTVAAMPIAAAGTRWTFTPAFYSQPFVSGNIVAPTAGDRVVLTWDANGRSYVSVQCFNAAGTAVAKNVDLLAYGPGSQLA
jgi:Putative phage tail protein